VPPARVATIAAWPKARLQRESRTVTRILRRFAEAVVDSMERAEAADAFLRELDLRAISRDHDWRAVFASLRSSGEGDVARKRDALVKYLQYLSHRKRLLEYVAAGCADLEETDQHSTITALALRFEPNAPPGSGERAAAPEGYLRLPLAESVELELDTRHPIPLMLAAREFRLEAGPPPALIDPRGERRVLARGRNMAGRHPESEVRVDRDFSDVSRAHVVMDWDGGRVLRLIDLSSRGTFVHESAIGES